jgi:hypothetical protein
MRIDALLARVPAGEPSRGARRQHRAVDEHFGNLDRDAYNAVKTGLDQLHKRKIDLADEILVLNVGGYIGDSTRSEIEHAEITGKPIRWLEPKPLHLRHAG